MTTTTTSDRLERMWERYNAGWSLNDIGEAEGITRERVRQIFTAAGYKSRSAVQTQLLKHHRVLESIDPETIRSAYLSDPNIQRIASRLGLSRKTINQILQPHLDEVEKRLRKSRSVVWSDEEIIASLQNAWRVAEGKFSHLTVAAYQTIVENEAFKSINDNKPAPSHQTVIKRYKGWNNALRAAGLHVGGKERLGIGRRHTDEQCIAAVLEVARMLDKMPTTAEYDANRGINAPSMATLRKRFGSWLNVLRAAGF